MADGEGTSPEDPLQFHGTPVTPATFYDGTDGRLWDDDRIVVPTSLLPAGTTTRTYGLRVQGDCLAMTYAALSYQHP